MSKNRLNQLFKSVMAHLATMAATIVCATALIEGLLFAAPGDPIDLLPNSNELRPILQERWGLSDDPMIGWSNSVLKTLQGDLGVSLSLKPGTPVAEVISGPLMTSLGLALSAIILSLLLAFFTSSSRIKPLLPAAIVGLSAAPLFLLIHVVVNTVNEVTFWGINAEYLARPDWFALPLEPSVFRTILAIVLLAIGSGAAWDMHDDISTAKRQIEASDFVLATEGRGHSIWPHIWRNLLPSIASSLSGRLPFYLGGLVILEQLFNLNGAGSLLWRSALNRDYPVAAGVALGFAVVVAVVRLVSHLIRAVIDPRLSSPQRRVR